MAVKKKRFRREDWIDLGLTQLSEKGPEGTKLEAICDAAKLTRGSFYYHFEDHSAFLLSLAKHWLKTQTTDIAKLVEAQTSADAATDLLNDAAMAIDYRLELGIREMGRRNGDVAAIIRAADAMRLDVLSALYAARFGLGPEEAADHAFLEYAAFSGLVLIDPDMDPERQRHLSERYDLMASTFLKQQVTT